MTGFVGLGFAAGARTLASKALKNAKSDWAAIPPKVKLVLLAVAAAVALFFVHQHYERTALKAADSAGYQRAKGEDAAALKTWRDRAQTAGTAGRAISQASRSKNDETNSTIAAGAVAVRVRGPGAASCGRIDHPAVPAASGQPGAGGDQPADAAGAQVSAADGQPDLAAVPWQWLVGRAEQCDLDRAEVLSWRSWYEQQAAAWAKLKSGTTAAKP